MPCVVPSLTDPFYSVLYLLLGWSGHFQAPDRQNWKPEVITEIDLHIFVRFCIYVHEG